MKLIKGRYVWAASIAALCLVTDEEKTLGTRVDNNDELILNPADCNEPTEAQLTDSEVSQPEETVSAFQEEATTEVAHENDN